MQTREKQINQQALLLAKEYMARTGESDSQKAFLIYKFANTSEQMIQHAFQQMGNVCQARFYFKSIARFVHPDKNKHPLANEVFQKISTALENTAQQAPRNFTFEKPQEDWDCYRENRATETFC